jgi:hypothetical protein
MRSIGVPGVTMAAAVLVLGSAMISLPARAGTQDGAVVALHAAPHSKSSVCSTIDPVSTGLPCRDFTTTWPLNSPCDVYLVVARGDPGPGISALSFGILYNHGETGDATMSDGEGVDLYGWINCWWTGPLADPPIPDQFPASGGGMRIAWNPALNCQTTVLGSDGVHVMVGAFYIYAYTDDLFEITPNRGIESSPEEFQVGDCEYNLTNLSYPEAAGAVAFGDGIGRNPCAPTPAQATTWSRLKNRYD